MRGKQAFKNIISNMLLQAITAASGLLLPRLYLLVYGSSMNGMVSSVTQFMSYLMLVESGISAASIVGLYKPLAYNDTERINGVLAATKEFYNQSGILYTLLVVVLAISYPLLIKDQVESRITREIVIILSLSNLIDYLFLGKYRVLLTADQKGYVVTVTQIVGTILNTIISIIMIMAGFSIVSVKLIATAVYIMRSVFIFWYIKKNYPYLNFKVKPLVECLGQRWSALIHQIAGVALNNTNLVILTFFGGRNSLLEISVYTIYQMVANMILTIISSFSGALSSGFGELISKGEGNLLKNAYAEYEFLFQILLFFSYTCMGLLFIPFVTIYTTGIADVNYIRPKVAVLFTLIGLVQNIRIPGITIICAAGHYSQTQRRAILEAIINVTVAIILVKNWGLSGVLFGTLAAFIYSTCHVLWYCNTYLLQHTIKKTLVRLFRNSALSIVCFIFAKLSGVLANSPQSYLTWFIHAVIIGIVSAIIFVIGNFSLEPQEMKKSFSRICSMIKK